MTNPESPVHRSMSRLGLLVLLGILSGAFLAAHAMAQPQLASGQNPLTDIKNIKTLRAQFNRDTGMTRLIILVVPT
jgi:hypothetical protein